MLVYLKRSDFTKIMFSGHYCYKLEICSFRSKTNCMFNMAIAKPYNSAGYYIMNFNLLINQAARNASPVFCLYTYLTTVLSI